MGFGSQPLGQPPGRQNLSHTLQVPRASAGLAGASIRFTSSTLAAVERAKRQAPSPHLPPMSVPSLSHTWLCLPSCPSPAPRLAPRTSNLSSNIWVQDSALCLHQNDTLSPVPSSLDITDPRCYLAFWVAHSIL